MQPTGLTTIAGSRVPVVLRAGALEDLGALARDRGFRRVLLVTDPGIEAAGHVHRAERSLLAAGVAVRIYDGARENPTTEHVEAGLAVARQFAPDSIVAIGGGSAMDCAKGVNFLHTNGGQMRDYWGTGKARRPMLPLIAVPTTAGTGSEAQSYALIADPVTHQKMACGDEKALPCLAVLDPQLSATAPRRVAVAAGVDAIAHAIETSASTRRNDTSRALSKRAWELLSRSFEIAVSDSPGELARADMLLGAHIAGAAIENSMLGAAHACANPLTARYGTPHGVAVGLMLPHVIRFNTAGGGDDPYADLGETDLAGTIERFLGVAGLPRRLAALGVHEDDLPALADMAARQWTATFNPRPVNADALLGIYRAAYDELPAGAGRSRPDRAS